MKRKKLQFNHVSIAFGLIQTICNTLEQVCTTYGPRAKCGPQSPKFCSLVSWIYLVYGYKLIRFGHWTFKKNYLVRHGACIVHPCPDLEGGGPKKWQRFITFWKTDVCSMSPTFYVQHLSTKVSRTRSFFVCTFWRKKCSWSFRNFDCLKEKAAKNMLFKICSFNNFKQIRLQNQR